MTVPVAPDAAGEAFAADGEAEGADAEPITVSSLSRDPGDSDASVGHDRGDSDELSVLFGVDRTDPDDLEDSDDLEAVEIVAGAGSARAGHRFGLAHPVSVLIAAVTGGLLAYAFHSGWRPAIVGVGVAQGLLILTWVARRRVVARIGATVLGAVTALAADLVVAHWRADVGALAAVLGLAPAALFAYQLARGRRRAQVLESLADTSLLLVAVTAFATLIELRNQVDGPLMTVAVVLGASAALVAGHLVDWVWDRLRFDPLVSRGVPAVLGSVIAGAAITMARLNHSIEFNGQRALLLGAALALVTALFAVGAAFLEVEDDPPTDEAHLDPSVRPRRWVEQTARLVFATLLVFALMSPLAYLLCLALRG